jgi:hypothetical protein
MHITVLQYLLKKIVPHKNSLGASVRRNNIKTRMINRIDLFSVLRIFLLNELSDNLHTMNIVHITIIKHKPKRKLAMIIW